MATSVAVSYDVYVRLFLCGVTLVSCRIAIILPHTQETRRLIWESGFWRSSPRGSPGAVLFSFQVHSPAVPGEGFVSADIYGLSDAHGPSYVFTSLLSVSVTRQPRFVPHSIGHLGRVVIDTHL